MSQITIDLNCVVLMYPTFCLLHDIFIEEIIGCGTRRGRFYYMDDFSSGKENQTRSIDNAEEQEIQLWHLRLGHPSFGYMKHLFPGLVSSTNMAEMKCEACILAKSYRVLYPSSSYKCNTPFALVHSDVRGPTPITSSDGIRWFITFLDDCTQMTWLYLLKHKNEALYVFKSFSFMIHTQFSATINILRSDNGNEYDNQLLHDFFKTNGLIREISCAQTPQQNGVVERKIGIY